MRVLELHASVRAVQRSSGRTAPAAAAYRSASRIECERTGQVHDYTRKQGVEATALLLPPGAPAWAQDRAALWNAAELREKHPRARPAREIEVGFPQEFNAGQRRAAGLAVAQLIVDRYGAVADVAWHAPGPQGDDRNYHCHVLFTTRGFENGDWSKTKNRALDDIHGGREEIRHLRQAVADIFNAIAARDRLNICVEHRSFADRGLDREPTQHLGPIATQMERRGTRSDIGDENRKIEKRNHRRQQLHAEHRSISAAIQRESGSRGHRALPARYAY